MLNDVIDFNRDNCLVVLFNVCSDIFCGWYIILLSRCKVLGFIVCNFMVIRLGSLDSGIVRGGCNESIFLYDCSLRDCRFFVCVRRFVRCCRCNGILLIFGVVFVIFGGIIIVFGRIFSFCKYLV